VKIQVYSYFHIPFNSISIVSANWIKQLSHFGHDVKVADYSGQNSRFEDIVEFLGEHLEPAPVGIYFGYPSYLKTLGNPVAKHRRRVGVFVTETDLKQTEGVYLTKIDWDRICVPSSYCKELFAKRNKKTSNLMVVNHGLADTFIYRGGDNPPKREKFTFLYIFQNSYSGGTVARKNLDGLLEAYRMFKTKHDADLIIKTTSNIGADIPGLEKTYGVRFDIRYLTPLELVELYNSCHAYVNPSKAEGFGMTVLEAMSCGLPAISPVHSGLTEFLTESNCIPIRFFPKREHYRYATNDGKIFKVAPSDMAESMILCYENYDYYRKNAEIQLSYIRERFTWGNVLKEFNRWLEA